ncbi:MAG TPA: ABC transporter permease [Streptosporangiaceae bacterium]|nr:ABC transporter permease [Streptosporangiaceae bacterium]
MAAVTSGGALRGVRPVRARRAGFTGAIRSEFTKIRSVRSTYASIGVMLLASIIWAVVFCAGTSAHWAQMSAQARGAVDPTQNSVSGLALLGQLVIVVLGALTITSEYSTGMMRTSLTVLPRRGIVYGSKAMVLAAVALAATFPASFLSFFIGQRFLTGIHAGATLSQPGVLRAVTEAALLVTLAGLFALGLGAVLRNTAGAIAAAYGCLFLIPELSRALPTPWLNDAQRWLPGGYLVPQITYTNPQGGIPHMFSPWVQLAVFAGYTAALLVAGAIVLRRRDA